MFFLNSFITYLRTVFTPQDPYFLGCHYANHLAGHSPTFSQIFPHFPTFSYSKAPDSNSLSSANDRTLFSDPKTFGGLSSGCSDGVCSVYFAYYNFGAAAVNRALKRLGCVYLEELFVLGSCH